MTSKRNFGEPEKRTGERRSNYCDPVAEKVCNDKHHYMEMNFVDKIDHLRESVDSRFKANAEALVLKAAENAAHFSSLNNAQARLDAFQGEFLRTELYNSEHKNLVDRVDKQSGKINTIELWRAGLEGRASRSNLISIIAILLSLIFSILHFWRPS